MKFNAKYLFSTSEQHHGQYPPIEVTTYLGS